MAATGARCRKAPSLSSASTTKTSPVPRWAFDPDSLSSLPIANDGSTPQCCRATVSIDVVVVLPCVPATATPRLPAMTAASASARLSSRIPLSRAAARSTLASGMAVETMRVSMPATRAASCPTRASTPTARRAWSRRESLASDPDTGTPWATMMRAMPDMPAPPMPTMWTRPSAAGSVIAHLPIPPA